MQNSNSNNTYLEKLTTISSYAGDWSKIIDLGKEIMVNITKSNTSAFDFVAALVSNLIQTNPRLKTKNIIGYNDFVLLFTNVGIECTIAKTTFVNARGASIIYNRLLAPEMANKLLSQVGRNSSDIIRSQLRHFASRDKKQILTALVSTDIIDSGNALIAKIGTIVKELNISAKPTKPKKQKPSKPVLVANSINNLHQNGSLEALNYHLQRLGLKIISCAVTNLKDESTKNNEYSDTIAPKGYETKDAKLSTEIDDNFENPQLSEVMQLVATNNANAVRSKVAKFVSSLLTPAERIQQNGIQNKIAWAAIRKEVELKLLYSQRSLDDLMSAFPHFFR